MRLYTVAHNGRRFLAVWDDGRLIDLAKAHAILLSSRGPTAGIMPSLPSDMLEFLQCGDAAFDAARIAVAFVGRPPTLPRGERLSFAPEEVTVLAPLRPGKILCAGVNYRSHAGEKPNAKLPESPFFFAKLPSVVIGPGEPIVHPRMTQQLDFEVELAVVIGRRMKHVSETTALAHVAGYTILDDVSARDVQFKDSQITLGKNFDTFCPLGPCLVTRDEIPHPESLRLRSLVNGQLMQDGSTSDWVFPLPTLLAHLSRIMTLEPGDVVSTGTPAGVGVYRNPPVFLQPGDTVAMEIDGLGRLENPVVAEP